MASDADIEKKNGKVYSSWNLAREYGFTDRDGSHPDWKSHFLKTYGKMYAEANDAAYQSWKNSAIEIAFPNWPIE